MKRYLSLLIILIFFVCDESVGQLFSNTGSLTGITVSYPSEVSIDNGSAPDWDGKSKYGCSSGDKIIVMKKRKSWFKFGFNVPSGYGVSGQFDARASHVHAVDYAYLEVYYRVTGDCKFDPDNIGINGWMLWGKFKVSGASCNTYDLPDIPAKITGGQPLEICFFYDGNGNFSDFIGIDNIKIDQSNYSAPPDVNSNPYIENFESAKWWAAGGYMGYPSTGNTGSEVYMPYHTETSNAASAFLNTGGPSHDPDNPKLNDENAKYSPSSNCVDFQAPPNSTTDNCNIGGGAPNNMKIIAPELNTTTCSKGAELRFAFQACYPQNPTGTAPNLNYQSLPNEQYRDYCPQVYCGTGTGSNITYTKVNDAYIHYYFPQGTWWYCTVELPKDKALKILIASSVMTGTAGTCYNSIDNIKVFCRDCTIDQYIGGAVSGASWVYSNTTYDYSINPYSHKYNNQNDSIKPSFYKWYVRKIFDNTSQQTTYTNADPPGYGECGTGEPCITSGQGTTSCTINFGTAGHYRILCIPYDDDPGTQDKPNIDVCAAAMSFKDIYACPVDLGSNITITTGGSTVLKPNGPGAGATYLWSDGSTGSSLTVKPTIATTYSVTTTINGCSDRDTVVVNVGNASCIADAGADKTICSGGSTILSAIGGNSYSWDNYLGADSTLNVYPTATTTYTVTATTGGTCTASDQVVITVSSLKVDAGADQTISAGSAVSLTATGSGGTPAYSYSWSDGKGGAWTSQSINPKPAGPLTYRVTITDSDAMVCTYNDSVHVCILTANAGPDQTINSGESATLTVTTTCGSSYLWDDPSKSTTATITVSPTVTTTYHVTVKGGTTAQATDDIVVTVIPAAKCKVEINSPNQTICQGDSISLIGSVTKGTGPFTYVWDDGSGQVGNTAAIYGIYPTRTSTFTLSVTFGDGCTASAKLLITLSDLAVDAGSDIIAEKGKSITLTATATGGVKPYDLYSWKSSDGTDYGSGQSNNLAIAPYASQKMYVTVYDANACASNDSLSICVLTVDAGPDVNISKGQSTTLSATPSCPGSGYTYKWDNGAPAVQNPKVTPPVTTTYVVTVTAPGGATAIDTVVVNVSSCAVDAGLPQTICSGNTATLTATPTGFTSPAYSWSNGLANVGNTQSISVNPAKTTTYYVTVTDNSGTCNVPASVVVNISDLKVVARNDTIVNKSVTFTLNCVASGGTFQYSYSWVSTTGTTWPQSTSSGQITRTVVSKGYIVTVTDTILGCTASDTMNVCVLTVDAGTDQTISKGQSTGINATPDCIINGYTYTYKWDNGAAGVQSPTVSPTTTTIYTVTLTATKGTATFTASDKVTVTV
ncbi:MAG: hypothetical protein Q8880_01760, partial [Bacteroidota bacterium]|nr:hypothetical protein [Bacteroidota bacterium]